MTLRPTLSQAQCSENVLVVLILLGEKGGEPLAVEELKSKIELQNSNANHGVAVFLCNLCIGSV